MSMFHGLSDFLIHHEISILGAKIFCFLFPIFSGVFGKSSTADFWAWRMLFNTWAGKNCCEENQIKLCFLMEDVLTLEVKDH